MKLRINVTKEILDKSKMCGIGYNRKTENCAIAIAIRDLFPNASVGMAYIMPYYEGFNNPIELPRLAQIFIKNFDSATPEQRVNFPEFSFEIDIPSSVIDKINIDEIRPLLVNHATLTLINN